MYLLRSHVGGVRGVSIQVVVSASVSDIWRSTGSVMEVTAAVVRKFGAPFSIEQLRLDSPDRMRYWSESSRQDSAIPI